MRMQPIAKEFIGDSDVRRRVFNPIQMCRDEPGVIDLLWDLTLDVMKRLLPNRVNAHKPLKFLYTGLFTPVDNSVVPELF